MFSSIIITAEGSHVPTILRKAGSNRKPGKYPMWMTQKKEGRGNSLFIVI